jgi:nucleoside-diphosphate-sugar epimerase
MMTENVLIAGCGDVGNALAKRLLGDGCSVWGVRRRVEALAPGIEPWRIDLIDPGTYGVPPAAFDVLFFTASADRRDEYAYRAIYVDALRNLLARLRESGCPLERVFFTSSTAVYGQTDGGWVDETSPTEPTGFNGRVLLDAERIIEEAPEIGVNVRLSGIYGPGRNRLVRKVWSGEAVATGSWTNRIHVEDCAGVLHHLMRLPNPESLYLGSDDEPATTAEVLTWIARELGKPTPEAGETAPRNKRCRNARLRQSGYRFIYPSFRDGYRDIVQAFLRKRGATSPSDG